MSGPPERDPDPYVFYTVVKRSLKLSTGKAVAQGQHALHYLLMEAIPERWPTREEITLRTKQHMHPEALTDADRTKLAQIEQESEDRYERAVRFREWANSIAHAKICLGASDDEFMQVQLENDPVFMVTDLGYTQVAPETQTCLGLWPCRKSQASPTVKTLRPL